MKTLKDVKLIKLKTHVEPDGNLVPIEFDEDIPFKVKRIFYVYGVHDQLDRGQHGHHNTKQVLICLNGEVEVMCDDGYERKTWILNNPSDALYIHELIWDEQIYTSNDTVLLVLSNTSYNPKDYIENYEEFKKLKNGTL
tara:strand:- start:1248 stop:1664 length:417 start_codon:yes stop_codon:yes gene_type:complete